MSERAAEVRRADVRAPARVGTWFDHHLYSFVASLGRVFRKPWATVLTVGVMALALALPLGLWLVLGNVARFAGDVQQSRQISVFLKQDTADARAAALAVELRGRGDIGEVEHRTPRQGLEALRERGDGFAEAIEAVGDNPLPHVLIVTPAGDEVLLASSLRQLQKRNSCSTTRNGGSASMAGCVSEARRVGARGATRIRRAAGGRQYRAPGHPVAARGDRRAATSRRHRWLSAGRSCISARGTDWQRRVRNRPADAGRLALRAPLQELAASYGASYVLHGFAPPHALGVLLGATLLGWFGAGLVTGHFLRQTRPTET